MWKLRQAQKGRIRVGPDERRATGEAADEAWRRLGFKNRTAMFKKAIADLLDAGGPT